VHAFAKADSSTVETLAEYSRRALIRTGGLTVIATVGGVIMPDALIAPVLAQELTGRGRGSNYSGARPKVTPPEDLMREHGVLERVLLIYEGGMRKFELHDDFDPAILADSAQIIHEFIEDYHEHSEEQYVFPRFKQAGKMVRLIDTLLQQHEAGRRLTQTILRTAPQSRLVEEPRRQLISAMRMFTAMYRPHAAREDTDLFPKLRDLVSSNEYDAMAEEFEKDERRRFGDDGFEKVVERVARLEHAIGVYDLDQYTPR
jgi:hemerythrin-like domain-containing protein